MTDLDLVALTELADKACAGPWFFEPDGVITDEARKLIGSCEHFGDAEFIAAARTAIPLLLAEVVRLRADKDSTNENEALGDAWDVVSHQEYADQDIAALLQLKDGRYATVVAWSDSSGFGCRDSTVWKVAKDRATAIALGLDKESRKRLGLSLDHETDPTSSAKDSCRG